MNVFELQNIKFHSLYTLELGIGQMLAEEPRCLSLGGNAENLGRYSFVLF
jgi:hypothetical protein